MAHLGLRRVDITTCDGCNVAQAQLAIGCATDGQRTQLLLGLQLPAHAQLHHVLRGLQGACGFHRVLLPQLRQHLVQVQAQLRQTLLGDFDEQLLILHAHEFDFVHVGHAQQALANIVGKGLDFSRAVTIGL